jgi:cell division septation protein DedD
MTRMAEPGRPQDELEDDEQRFEDEGRRSIFSALWFRAILVVVVLGVVAAVAVPYVLELANQPAPKPTVVVRPETAAPSAPIVPPSPPAETTPPQAPAAAPAMEKPPAAEKPPVAEKAPAPEKAAPAPSRKADARTAAVAKESATSRPKATSPAPTMQGQGAYFVQVGAFKSEDTAKRLATRLRELKYSVDERAASGGANTAASAPAPSGSPAGDKYDVYVMGGTAADINAKLGPKGLTSEPSAGGVVVKPSLPLRDAVALSKDLAIDGLKVQVRRSSGGVASASASAAAKAAPSSDGLYRVRVGPFDDRAAATSTLHELEQRGYTPFIARAGQ